MKDINEKDEFGVKRGGTTRMEEKDSDVNKFFGQSVQLNSKRT